MAFNDKQILTGFLFIWLSFIEVSGFVVFNERKGLDSAGSFNENAQTRESFDRGDETSKSGAQVGRLLIWQDQASKSHGGGGIVSLSSDLSPRSQPDESGYQSDDSGWMKLQPLWGQVYGVNTLYTPTVEKLLGMKPTVDCAGDLMKLTVHGREAPFGSNFLIDRGSIPPLPLSQLPSECGHRFLRTWRDFVFIIPYDGCYVMHERDAFVLPLLWWGLPVKMSCSSPTSAKSVPTVSCYTNGMIVRVHRGVSENLKIKVKNEWQPLLKVSARCGYSLVSHPEGVVIHAPYMPCMEPKDGMFTLIMAIESEFNLSCPALSLSLPVDTPDLVREDERISISHALTSTTLPPTTITTTTKPTQPKRTPATSSIQKLPTPPLPYYIPGQPDFKPVPLSYPFLSFPPNMPPKVLPQGPKTVDPPTAITQRPQAPVYTKRPPTWYPKPSLGLTCDPSHQSTAGPHFLRKPLLPPTKAPTAPDTPLLKPTGSPQDELLFTVPVVPPVHWWPMFPPSNIYPLYPGEPEFAAPTSAVFPQIPNWSHHSHTKQRHSEPHAPPIPEPEPPTPAPTRKTGPQLLHLWYKPFLPRRSEIPPVPKNNTISTCGAVASRSTTYSESSEQVEEDPPMKLQIDFTPDTHPTPSHPKCPEVVHTPAPIKAPPTPVSSSCADSFHCPTFCPGPPSMIYHHHNHHHFAHPLQMSNFDISSTTKITGQMLSSPVVSPDSNLLPLIQGMGYNYGPFYSKDTAVPPASDRTAMQYLVENPPIKSTDAPGTSRYFTGPTMCPYIFRKLESTAASPRPTMKPANVAFIRPLEPSKNRPVAEPLAYSSHSPNPAVNQAEMQQYFPPMGHESQPILVALNNVGPFSQKREHYISSKPTTHGTNVFLSSWHQAVNLNSKPSMSDSLTKDTLTQMSLPQPPNNHNPFEPSTASLQPEQTRGENPPPHLSFHPLMQIRNSVPVMNPQMYFPPNRESVVPVFRGSKLFNMRWTPAVQSNKDALLSSSQTDG